MSPIGLSDTKISPILNEEQKNGQYVRLLGLMSWKEVWFTSFPHSTESIHIDTNYGAAKISIKDYV